MSHRISTQLHNGRTVYTLHDDQSGASASILPSYGFNLFDLRLPAAGSVRSIVVSADDFLDNLVKPARNGIPVLFPYPNRIDHARFAFEGKSYSLPPDKPPHAIHGFALNAAWDVVELTSSDDAAAIGGRYQISKNSPERLAHWPSDAILEIRYALSGQRLTMTVTVTNPTSHDLPYGFGIHPYFRLPFGLEGDTAKTQVVIPASQYWVLDESIPTGERQPVDDRLDFRSGKPMKGLQLDDVLTGLIQGEDGRTVCRLQDLNLGAEFRLSFDKLVREIVVFTPAGTNAVIAVEPYTQTTDAINLAAKGVDGGLRVLGRGMSESLTIVMETVG